MNRRKKQLFAISDPPHRSSAVIAYHVLEFRYKEFSKYFGAWEKFR